MISNEQARRIEKSLAELLKVAPEAIGDLISGRIDRPRGEDGRPITGWRMQRGSHGFAYVQDPEGTDPIPAGSQN
jgi:hypothetical protein